MNVNSLITLGNHCPCHDHSISNVSFRLFFSNPPRLQHMNKIVLHVHVVDSFLQNKDRSVPILMILVSSLGMLGGGKGF